MPKPLLFPLNRIGPADLPALQFAARAPKLMQPSFMQQRPRSAGRRLAPETPINRPWNVTSSRFGIVDVPSRVMPSVVHQLLPIPPAWFKVEGITRDSAGVALAGCTVKVYRSSDDLMVGSTISDANGVFSVQLASGLETYYVRYYLAGAPDVAGTSQNGLSPS